MFRRRTLAVIGSNELQRFDREALAASGIAIHPLRIESRFYRLDDLRFVNDGHFNAQGHWLLAEHLTPVFAAAVSARGS